MISSKSRHKNSSSLRDVVSPNFAVEKNYIKEKKGEGEGKEKKDEDLHCIKPA